MDKHIKQGINSILLVQLQYGVNSRQIQRWCAWYRQNGIPKQMTGKRKGRPKLDGAEEILEQNGRRNQTKVKFKAISLLSNSYSVSSIMSILCC